MIVGQAGLQEAGNDQLIQVRDASINTHPSYFDVTFKEVIRGLFHKAGPSNSKLGTFRVQRINC